MDHYKITSADIRKLKRELFNRVYLVHPKFRNNIVVKMTFEKQEDIPEIKRCLIQDYNNLIADQVNEIIKETNSFPYFFKIPVIKIPTEKDPLYPIYHLSIIDFVIDNDDPPIDDSGSDYDDTEFVEIDDSNIGYHDTLNHVQKFSSYITDYMDKKSS